MSIRTELVFDNIRNPHEILRFDKGFYDINTEEFNRMTACDIIASTSSPCNTVQLRACWLDNMLVYAYLQFSNKARGLTSHTSRLLQDQISNLGRHAIQGSLNHCGLYSLNKTRSIHNISEVILEDLRLGDIPERQTDNNGYGESFQYHIERFFDDNIAEIASHYVDFAEISKL